MLRITLSILLLTLFNSLNSQVSYNDVAVIVNNNSQVSLDIGTYFRIHRNIPNQNMIYVSVPEQETTDSLGFEDLRQQVEDYLTTNNLTDSINYLVTTKGLPLKVERSNCSSAFGPQTCSSVESDLSLILGPNSGDIGGNGLIPNPYFSSGDHFSRSNFGIYLVTRLDGYSYSDVINLIDRSGPGTPVNQSTANNIVDISHTTSAVEQAFYENHYQQAHDTLVAGGWNAIWHPDTTRLIDQNNVFMYASIEFQSYMDVNINCVPGSIVSNITSVDYETFNPANNPQNAYLLGDFVAQGATGGHGFVYTTFASMIPRNEMIFSRYSDTSLHFNLAESYFAGEQRLSWSSFVLGDPKASISIDNTVNIIALEGNEIDIYPNPTSDFLQIDLNDFQSDRLAVTNLLGDIVLRRESPSNGQVQLNLSSLSSGTYFLLIDIPIGRIQRKIVVSR